MDLIADRLNPVSAIVGQQIKIAFSKLVESKLLHIIWLIVEDFSRRCFTVAHLHADDGVTERREADDRNNVFAVLFQSANPCREWITLTIDRE